MKLILRPVLSAGIVLMMTASCGKTSSKPPMRNPADSTGTTTPGGGTSAPKTTDIYICGADNGKPCYWKNDTEVLLPLTGAIGGGALSIVAQGTDVYVAGYALSSNDIYSAGPLYWKNGVAKSLQPRTSGGIPTVGGYWATAITFADTNLYVAIDQHWDTSSLKDDDYLKIGPSGFSTQYGIPDAGNAPTVNAIFVSGTDVYLAGAGAKVTGQQYGTTFVTAFPGYYKNPGNGGGEHLLPTNLPLPFGIDFYFGQASGISVSGSDVYVCGFVQQGENYRLNYQQPQNYYPAYWKNDSLQLLISTPSNLSAIGNASAICLSGNDVYISGTVYTSDLYYTCGYWKNGTFTALANSANANSIGVSSGGDVYVAGQVGDFGESSAAVWKNGTQTVLATGGVSVANQLFVYTH